MCEQNVYQANFLTLLLGGTICLKLSKAKFRQYCIIITKIKRKKIVNTLHGKNSSAKVVKNLNRYRSEKMLDPLSE